MHINSETFEWFSVRNIWQASGGCPDMNLKYTFRRFIWEIHKALWLDLTDSTLLCEHCCRVLYEYTRIKKDGGRFFYVLATPKQSACYISSCSPLNCHLRQKSIWGASSAPQQHTTQWRVDFEAMKLSSFCISRHPWSLMDATFL